MSISFIVPTLNEQGNVSRVYSLIVEALENTPIDWEMIFVDDKSTDNTQLEIRKLDDARVRLIISPERRGPGARPPGWRTAKGRPSLSGASRATILRARRRERTAGEYDGRSLAQVLKFGNLLFGLRRAAGCPVGGDLCAVSV